jgi:hypothetical protein
MTSAGGEGAVITASIIWGTERASRTLSCRDSAGREALEAHRRCGSSGAICWDTGDGSCVLVASFVERAPSDSRDTPAWLVIGPLPLSEAQELAYRADSLAYALQSAARRTISVPSVLELPQAKHPPRGWSLRRPDGYTGGVDIKAVGSAVVDPSVTPGSGASTSLGVGRRSPVHEPQTPRLQYVIIALSASALIVSIAAIATVRGISVQVSQNIDLAKRVQQLESQMEIIKRQPSNADIQQK